MVAQKTQLSAKKMYLCSMIVKDKLLNRYRYALCNDHVVSIDDVTKESRKSSKFTCLGCGHEMVAVLGDIREHHFRHKNNENCSNETYLHNLAKKRIKEIFDNQEDFLIRYRATNSCDLFGSCPLHFCKKEFKWNLNLKEFFDTCEIEKGCGKFRPDILLTHSKYPNRKLFIEINVNHPCTDEKLNSGFRIIEIDVDCEQTIIYPFDEEFENIHFFNFDFNREIKPSKKLERFSLIGIDEKNKETKQDSIDCCQLNDHLPNAVFDITIKKTNDSISLDLLGLAQTMIHGITVRHCGFCNNRWRCVVSYDKNIIDKDGNKKVVQCKVKPEKLSNEMQWKVAERCTTYQPNISGCHKLIRQYGPQNFILWEKKN